VSIFAIIMMIIKYGPAVWTLVQEIVELIRKLRGQEAEAFTVELERAAKHYKETKDRRPLRELRSRLQKRCFGPECEVK
jgi:hypothetical protein